MIHFINTFKYYWYFEDNGVSIYIKSDMYVNMYVFLLTKIGQFAQSTKPLGLMLLIINASGIIE